jgi:hypothetical protein
MLPFPPWMSFYVRPTIHMNALAIVSSVFGFVGFVFALGAWHRIRKIEAELKRRQVIDQEFDSGRW